MTEEMRELFDEMEALMEEMKTDEWMKKLEELQMSNEDLEKELDRNLEMLKKFEFEQALEESIDKLKEIITKYNSIESKMSDPSLVNNLDEFKKVTKEHNRLKPIVEKSKGTSSFFLDGIGEWERFNSWDELIDWAFIDNNLNVNAPF